MILSEIGNYLRQHQRASLQEMSRHFATPPEAIRGMLETWIRKGRVSRQTITSSCGGSCCQCDPATTEIYQWSGHGAKDHSVQVLPNPSACGR
ncbi:MAG: FeoC-like transcriptional regulator [Gammaproteobacteria bacterium]|nr:FeoC-like transcriptional regulator [Gammaproteobacteria bacterium]